jgi:hypothetical protein
MIKNGPYFELIGVSNQHLSTRFEQGTNITLSGDQFRWWQIDIVVAAKITLNDIFEEIFSYNLDAQV